jgi:hypothetical protein
MTVIPFPARVSEPARTLADLVARTRSPHPSCDVTVTKDTRTRRYTLISDAPGSFVGEVWFGRCQHRKKRVAGVHDARMLACQFVRELRDLITDGWAT